MTDFTGVPTSGLPLKSGAEDSEARIFRFVITNGNEREQRAQRAQITRAMLRHNPQLKEAIGEDVSKLALQAVEARGYAEMHDLTRAGYSDDLAEWSADTLAAAGRKADAKRHFGGPRQRLGQLGRGRKRCGMSDLIKQHIGQNILILIAGHRFEDGTSAQCDALACSIGGVFHLSGKTKEEAVTFAEHCLQNIIDHIEREWGKIEEVPAQ